MNSHKVIVKYPPISRNYCRRANNSPFVRGFLYHWVTGSTKRGFFSRLTSTPARPSIRWCFSKHRFIPPPPVSRQCINILLYSTGSTKRGFVFQRTSPRLNLLHLVFYNVDITRWKYWAESSWWQRTLQQFFFPFRFNLTGRIPVPRFFLNFDRVAFSPPSTHIYSVRDTIVTIAWIIRIDLSYYLSHVIFSLPTRGIDHRTGFSTFSLVPDRLFISLRSLHHAVCS